MGTLSYKRIPSPPHGKTCLTAVVMLVPDSKATTLMICFKESISAAIGLGRIWSGTELFRLAKLFKIK